jgi:hypothetical protein
MLHNEMIFQLLISERSVVTQFTAVVVCLFVTMRPAGTQMYLRIILPQFYKLQ